MEVLSIVLIIAGVLVTFFSSIIFCSSSSALNKKNWDKFVEQAQEKGLPMSEDELYKLTNKINTYTCITLIIGLIMVGMGVMIRLLMK